MSDKQKDLRTNETVASEETRDAALGQDGH